MRLPFGFSFDTWLKALINGTAILAVPVQALVEVAIWLKTSEWPSYDGYWYLGEEASLSLISTNWLGLNIIVATILNFWITIIALPLALIFSYLITRG